MKRSSCLNDSKEKGGWGSERTVSMTSERIPSSWYSFLKRTMNLFLEMDPVSFIEKSE